MKIREKIDMGIIEKNEEYALPPIDEKDTALICSLGDDNFMVIAHTGRTFFNLLELAGYSPEECGIECPPEDEIGFFVLEDHKYWTKTDWESGVIDDFGVSGTYRRATKKDFEFYGRLDCIQGLV